MGNNTGKAANRLAISAMANVTRIEKDQLRTLQRKFMELAKRQGNPNTITSDEFGEALQAVGIHESDAEILNRLFVMLDKSGDDQINFREFAVGIAPLITGDVMEKMAFSFQLYDQEESGRISQAEMLFVLTAMNNTASYFGDPVMTPDQVEEVVVDTFKKHDADNNGELDYNEFLEAVVAHPVLVQFVAGGGSVRYGQ
mmetsp:Transcript_33602/g.106190  ORF Transcript_33602/g.106190 Transcript_33602/m.106190 type:complete len:199 (-) Transcript_33602:367-963(-)